MLEGQWGGRAVPEETGREQGGNISLNLPLTQAAQMPQLGDSLDQGPGSTNTP